MCPPSPPLRCVLLISEYPDYLSSCTPGAALAPLVAAPYNPHIATARAECYSHAFFQALSQMLCIGYGLVNPHNTEEVGRPRVHAACPG